MIGFIVGLVGLVTGKLRGARNAVVKVPMELHDLTDVDVDYCEHPIRVFESAGVEVPHHWKLGMAINDIDETPRSGKVRLRMARFRLMEDGEVNVRNEMKWPGARVASLTETAAYIRCAKKRDFKQTNRLICMGSTVGSYVTEKVWFEPELCKVEMVFTLAPLGHDYDVLVVLNA
jgi:hypothetical protein